MSKSKTRTQFVCQQCGSTQPKWMGRCPDCGEWNSFVEVVEQRPKPSERSATGAPRAKPQRLTEIALSQVARLPVEIQEFARVMGGSPGGIVPGSLTLVGGDPGIGKSTLLMQLAASMATEQCPVLYVSGEESVQQLKLRADRLGMATDHLFLVTETDLDVIIGHIVEIIPKLVVVDSIQTMYLDELTSAAGSISQVRECAARMQNLCKTSGVAVMLVGHVTKSGALAGPKVLEHIVDTVLYLEGDRFHTYRLLRSVKNRFGATSEVGVFEMRGDGMVEVNNPSEAFLAERLASAPGSSIAVTMEGTRPLLVEVQALASTTSFGLPRRTPNGVDMNRLLLLVAVLQKRIGLKLGDQDVFVNVIGGLRIGEPAADLAIALAIASSVRDAPVAPDLAIIGEVGLSGELRAVSQLAARLNEASKLGFQRCLVPKSIRKQRIENAPAGLEVIGARSLGEAMDVAIGQHK